MRCLICYKLYITANDESSLYTCDDTTDVSMGPQDSELDTTASDSFAYVNFKPVPDITGTVFRETGLNQTSIGPTFAFRIDSYSVYTG
jgi:hypothetical protein